MAEFKTTKKSGLSCSLPAREPVMEHARPIQTGPADDVALDEGTFLRRLEADLGDDENRRKIRGIVKGVAVGTLLWILLIAVVVIVL